MPLTASCAAAVAASALAAAALATGSARAAVISPPQAIEGEVTQTVVGADGSALLAGFDLSDAHVASAAPGAAFGALRTFSLGSEGFASGLDDVELAADGSGVAIDEDIERSRERVIAFDAAGTTTSTLTAGDRIYTDVDVFADGTAVAGFLHRKTSYVAVKPPGGTFGKPQVLPGAHDLVTVAAGPGGSALVATAGAAERVFVVRDGVAGPGTRLPDFASDPTLAMRPDGSGLLAWDGLGEDDAATLDVLEVGATDTRGTAAPRTLSTAAYDPRTPDDGDTQGVQIAVSPAGDSTAVAWPHGRALEVFEGPGLATATRFASRRAVLSVGSGRQAVVVTPSVKRGQPAVTVTLRRADGSRTTLRSPKRVPESTVVTAATRVLPDGSALVTADVGDSPYPDVRVFRVTP